jgi:integrase
MVLQKALRKAQQPDIVTRNVVSLVDGPAAPEDEMKVYTPEQASTFLGSCRSDRLEALYWLALAHGLRRGELLGLKWEDISFETSTLSVRRTLGRSNSGIVVGPPKTKKGTRSITLCEPAIAHLRAHRKAQLERRLIEGPEWRDGGWVFTTGIGTTLDPRGLSLNFSKAASKAAEAWHKARPNEDAMKGLRFHDLRHSAATIALSQNIHPKVVSEMLGHAKVAITLDMYSHVLPNMQAEAAVKMGDVLAGGR